MGKGKIQTICTNIFKDGKNTTSKEEFTLQMIQLIHQSERGKNAYPAAAHTNAPLGHNP